MDTKEIISILNKYIDELNGILSRFKKSSDGLYIKTEDGQRLREIVTEVTDFFQDHIPASQRYSSMVVQYFNQGIQNWLESSSYDSVDRIRGVLTSLITRIQRTPSLFEGSQEIKTAKPDNYESIFLLINRFHMVVRQLRERYNERTTLEVEDEYDVQDLFHSLLWIYFNDVRKEEWSPSYAGASSRIDFLLPEIDTVVEVKKTRKGLVSREVGEQLIVDIVKYKEHPQCRRLVCFVYDPEGRISNPRGLENDLNNSSSEIDVQVCIIPKHQ